VLQLGQGTELCKTPFNCTITMSCAMHLPLRCYVTTFGQLPLQMHTIYDLKGSTVGRYKKEGETVRYTLNSYTCSSYKRVQTQGVILSFDGSSTTLYCATLHCATAAVVQLLLAETSLLMTNQCTHTVHCARIHTLHCFMHAGEQRCRLDTQWQQAALRQAACSFSRCHQRGCQLSS
jgi:hypothetical protein